MLESQLKQLGMSESHAKAYSTLVEVGSLTPNQLAEKTGTTRTNSYMILNKLAEGNLAFKDEEKKKVVFRPLSPIGLRKIAEKRRAEAYEMELKIKDALPGLVNEFHSKRTQPGIRFVQGNNGLRKIYKEHLSEGGNAVVFSTRADSEFYGNEGLDKYIRESSEMGITRELISPDTPGRKANYKLHKWGRTVTWVPEQFYKSPVEIVVWGNKTTITSFGEESVAMIIESKQIAEAMREIFTIAKAGGKVA